MLCHFLCSVLFLNLCLRQPFLNCRHHHANLNWLGYKIIHSLSAEHLLCSLHRVSRECDNGNIIVLLMKTPNNAGGLHTIHLRHHMIHKYNIIAVAGDLLHSLLAAKRPVYLHLKRLQQSLRHCQINWIIIHNKNLCFWRNKLKILITHFILAAHFLIIKHHGNI